ncbi:MAG TPA: TAXI family TRAP transporter solute-binding subunit [Methylocella sp.]|nr:TAXI family TRAP transporter solute-binding subunit [Methylocella sp.]
MFSLRLPRLFTSLMAAAFLMIAALLGALYLWSPRATLRITTGPAGGDADHFISTFISVTTALHPRIQFTPVPVPDLAASSKALEDGKVDIAVVRSDVLPPANGQTLVILRRDVIAVFLPPGSPVKDLAGLAGKKIGIPAGFLQNENSAAFDKILGYYNVAPAAVKREFLPIPELAAEFHKKHLAAALAIGSIGPGEAVNLATALAKGAKKEPDVLAIDEADAIAKQFPEFDSTDIPEGAFKGRPAIPSDTAHTLAVTYRFVVPTTMLNVVAGAVARSVIKAKGKLMVATPLANQIEAPDTDNENPLLPVHPGVAAYLQNGDQSFFDEFQQYFYYIGIPLSLLASLAALVSGFMRNRKLEKDQQQIFRLLAIADEAMKADASQITALETEFHAIVSSCVNKLAGGSASTDQWPVSLAIEHARRSIGARKATLGTGPFAQMERRAAE